MQSSFQQHRVSLNLRSMKTPIASEWAALCIVAGWGAGSNPSKPLQGWVTEDFQVLRGWGSGENSLTAGAVNPNFILVC